MKRKQILLIGITFILQTFKVLMGEFGVNHLITKHELNYIPDPLDTLQADNQTTGGSQSDDGELGNQPTKYS